MRRMCRQPHRWQQCQLPESEHKRTTAGSEIEPPAAWIRAAAASKEGRPGESEEKDDSGGAEIRVLSSTRSSSGSDRTWSHGPMDTTIGSASSNAASLPLIPISATVPMEATLGRHHAQRRAEVEARDVFTASGDFNLTLLNELEAQAVGERLIGCCKELNPADGDHGEVIGAELTSRRAGLRKGEGEEGNVAEF
uniref:Uncharacterized protein n=1 Tax=Oryza meridionalis TaxID=40149 RepID=A0A0E0C0J3_9ORYZ